MQHETPPAPPTTPATFALEAARRPNTAPRVLRVQTNVRAGESHDAASGLPTGKRTHKP